MTESRYFLRHAPLFISAEQRIRYESICICVEIMEQNFKHIKSIAREKVLISVDNPKFDNAEITKIFSLCWGIVDQSYLITKLVKAEGENLKLDSYDRFLEFSEEVIKLRNWMDHLPERLGNYLKQCSPLPPVHGALSFTAVLEGELVDGFMKKYNVVVLLSSASHRSLRVQGEPYKYKVFEIPVDHFVLQSFGVNLKLTSLVDTATKFCDELGQKVQLFCENKANELDGVDGKSRIEWMKHPEQTAGVLVMRATLNFG